MKNGLSQTEPVQELPPIAAEAEAILQSIIRFKMRSWPHELEDLFQEARLQLWQRMQVVKDVPNEAWRSIAATIAWRVCAQRVRQAHPQFQALAASRALCADAAKRLRAVA